jgi:membrane-associated phospholipid phosphatase
MVLNSGESVDRRILEWVDGHRTPGADHLTRGVMYAGTTPWCLLVGALVALGIVVRLKAYRPAIAGLVALAVAGAAATLLKHVFERARPPAGLVLITVGGFSFPSTQAAITSALAVAVFVAVAWRSARTAYLVAALLLGLVVFVGACLVYLGAHWPSDVAAGWLLGGLIGLACGRWLGSARRSRT